MPELNSPSDFISDMQQPKPIPSGINVLTILTFIGCAIGLIFGVLGFVNGKKNVDQIETALNSPNYDSMPSFAKKMVSPEALEIARKSYDNRVPIFVLSLVAIVLCFYGALQMRKLKMQGYYLYLAGEILPLITSLIFLGAAALSGVVGMISIFLIALFVLLYTMQRKYLVS